MPGHNNWSKIKRLKGALDGERGRFFSAFRKKSSSPRGSVAATPLPILSCGRPPRRRGPNPCRINPSPSPLRNGTGAEELTRNDEQFVILSPPDQLYLVAEAFKTAGIEPESPKLTFLAEKIVAVTDGQIAVQVAKLRHTLDDLDDVMNVHSYFHIPEPTLAKLSAR